jgi:catechol 2,3-dioxygenase-like lactoylglutathione lyase family enzyme
MISVSLIDHVVLTVDCIPVTVEFYERVLGMVAVTFGDDRIALKFGSQKINLHEAGREIEPGAAKPMPGSADLCLLTDNSIKEISRHLKQCGVEIIEGPVKRTGACGALLSVYIRDPDQNLIEISNTL